MEIKTALEESVGAHMIADVPVGCFLSSGIDSNVICAMAQRHLSTEQLSAVTLGFKEYEGSPDDEIPIAKVNARRWGVKHQVLTVAKDEFLGNLHSFFESMDQPTVDGVNTYFVSKVAAQAGLKVALSGVGGDEIFGGYPSFGQIPRILRACRHVPAPCRIGRALRLVTVPLARRFTSPKWAGILEYGFTCERAYLLRRGLFMPWELPTVLDAEIIKEGWQALEPLAGMEIKTNGIGSAYAKVMALEIACYLQSRLLRDTDWAGMAHSIEIRTPYVDAFFFRRMASLMKVSDVPPSKRDLAAVSPLLLSKSILDRPKTGFSVPVQEWLADANPEYRKHRGLRGWALRVAREFRF
jgi:asparagine synthase (glutamine-hydrolysing)